MHDYSKKLKSPESQSYIVSYRGGAPLLTIANMHKTIIYIPFITNNDVTTLMNYLNVITITKYHNKIRLTHNLKLNANWKSKIQSSELLESSVYFFKKWNTT